MYDMNTDMYAATRGQAPSLRQTRDTCGQEIIIIAVTDIPWEMHHFISIPEK